MDEHEAIARLKRGQIEGLAPLVQRHQRQAIYAATPITRARPLAEAIVQTAFLRVYERIALNADEGSLFTQEQLVKVASSLAPVKR